MKTLAIRRAALAAAALGIWGLATTGAWAGNDAYFVTYNHHISKGELELMVMNDFTAPSRINREEEGQHSYFSNMIELEYGVTDQFSTEFMLEGFEEVATGKSRFTGFRWENRYRLFRNDVPFNPVLYMEYEDLDPETRFKMEVSGWVHPPYRETGGEAKRERIMETRLVLSQDFGPLNVAFNWINETDLNESGATDFGYAMGVRYDLNHGHYGRHQEEGNEQAHGKHHEHGITLGVELYGSLGDTRKFGIDLDRQQHYLQPLIMFHLKEDVMFHLGLAIGLSDASDDLVRTGVAFEF